MLVAGAGFEPATFGLCSSQLNSEVGSMSEVPTTLKERGKRRTSPQMLEIKVSRVGLEPTTRWLKDNGGYPL
jgi:hypothetical protein